MTHQISSPEIPDTSSDGVDVPSATAIDPRIRDALLHIESWIGSAPHGDNCYLSDHYEGDPGNRCNCGKESALSSIEQALEVIAADGVTVDRHQTQSQHPPMSDSPP